MTWICPRCGTRYQTGEGWKRRKDGDHICVECGMIVWCACGKHPLVEIDGELRRLGYHWDVK